METAEAIRTIDLSADPFPRWNCTVSAVSEVSDASRNRDGWDQYDPTSMYDQKGVSVLRGFSAQAPSELVDPFSGNLVLRHTDLHLPGVGGLDLTVMRVYNSKIHRNYAARASGDPARVAMGMLFVPLSPVGVGWSMHMGRLVGALNSWPNAALPGPRYYEKSDGSHHPFFQYIGPGCGDETTDICLLTKEKDNPYSTGESDPWIITTADGLNITFAHSTFDGHTLVDYATEIRDIHGNTIEIFYLGDTILIDGVEYQRAYLPHFIDYIIDSAGRTIDFHYDVVAGDEIRLSAITANGRQYLYYYDADTPHLQAFLTEARPPEGSSWFYEYAGLIDGNCVDNSRRWCELTGITYPTGGTVTYTFDDLIFWSQTNPMSVRAVGQRDVGGREVMPASWSYVYNREPDYAEDEHTVISRPDGSAEIYTYFGVGDGSYNPLGLAWKAGVLLEKKVRDDQGAVLQKETFDWVASPPISNEIWGDLWTGFDIGVFVPRLQSHVIQRGSLTWTTEHTSFHDSNNRPRCTTETGDGATRYRLRTYVTENSYQGDLLFRYLNLLHVDMLSYDPFPLAVCDPAQNTPLTPALGDEVVVHLHNSYGQVVNAERNGIRTDYTYHSDGNLRAEISYQEDDGEGNPTNGFCTTYDDYQYGVARRIGSGAPAPACNASVYDVIRTVDWFGGIESWANGRGYTTEFAYDDLGRVTRIVPPGESHEAEVLITYDGGLGVYNTSQTVSQGPYQVETQYDGFARELAKETAVGVHVRQTYDAMGRISFRSLPDTEPDSTDGDSFAYDVLGRLTRVTHVDDSTVDYAYGASAHTVTITDELQRDRVYTRRAYANPDDFLLIRVQLPGESAPYWDTYTYLVGGHLTGVYYGGIQRNITYNFAKKVKHQYSPETNNLFFGYDAAGNLRCRDRGADDDYCRDANWDDERALVRYEVDGVGRMTAMLYSDPSTPDVTFSYDDADNLELMIDGVGSHGFSYTPTNRPESRTTTIDGMVYTTGYTYDERGNLEDLVYPSGRTVSYEYDVGNRVTRVADASTTYAHSIDYHPNGMLCRMTYGNGVVTTQGLDVRQRPDDLQASEVMDLNYDYDDVGNITSLGDAVTGYAVTFAYDGLDRLKDADGPWGNLHYSYNDVGDRIHERLNGVYTYYQYDGFGQLSSLAGRMYLNFAYDDFGNALERSIPGGHGYAYTYDAMNRLIEVTGHEADGTTVPVVEYAYDGQGQRLRANRPTSADNRVYHHDHQDNRIAESTDQGFMLTEYILINGRAIAEMDVRQYPGDVNCDRQVDLGDLGFLHECFTGAGEPVPDDPLGCVSADLDGDTDVDCFDMAIMESNLDLGDCAFGDSDCDKDIDYADYAIYALGLEGPLAGSPCAAFDSDGDDDLDLADYAAFQRAFTRYRPPDKFWIVDADGLWHDPANWSDGAIPGLDNVVLIDRPADEFTITVNEGEQGCVSLVSEERLVIAGGTLTVSDTVQVNNEFKLGAGTLAGGTILPGSSGEGLTPPTSAERGTLSGVDLQASMLLQSGGFLNIAEGMTLGGVITMSASTGLAQLQFLGAGTLEGAGEIVLASGVNGTQGLWSADEPWIIGPGMTIRGGRGIVGGKGFVNFGTIHAETAGESITVNMGSNDGVIEATGGGEVRVRGDSFGGTPWLNNGTVRASSGAILTFEINWQNDGIITLADSTVNFGGIFTRGAIGSLQRTGGTVNISGTLDNTASMLVLDSTTGSWTLDGGTVLGGTVSTTDGAELISAEAGGALDAVTLNGELHVTGGTMTFLNDVVLNGTATVEGLIEFEADDTFLGVGEVILAGGAVRPAWSSLTLVIGPNMTIRTGDGGGAVGQTQYGTLINQGMIIADVAGQGITLAGTHFSNEGVVAAMNGGYIRAKARTGTSAPGTWTNTGTISVGQGSSFTADPFYCEDFTQASIGSISIDIGGLSGSERGIVTLGNEAVGTLAVTLDGTLNIVLVDAFEPSVGSIVEAVTYSPGSRVGEFATINGLDIGNGTVFEVTYSDNALLLEVVAP